MWQRLLIENGYAARTIPKEYGGYGAQPDPLKAHIIAEEFAKAGVRPGHSGDNRLVPTVLELGTEEQKRWLVPPSIRGRNEVGVKGIQSHRVAPISRPCRRARMWMAMTS